MQRGDTANKSFAFVTALTNITSEPNGAEILVDGQARGHTGSSGFARAVARMVAHLDGWPDEQQRIDVVAQRDNAAHFVFVNMAENHQRTGAVTVIATSEMGQTPLVIEEVKWRRQYELCAYPHYKPGRRYRKVDRNSRPFWQRV